MDLDEELVVDSEKIAARVRNQILSSGDESLVQIIKQHPEESWSHLKQILGAA
jgi:ribosomal 50S subunit-associated protein YjgA (DUF615 family)